ncbi:MAG TPA: hypothetical protein DCQ06_09820, partial [Myxococcales bacterium]|nr:hypothetical protein [Myxococcales bacterium]HAN31881.1 hypothetical protein [Myxococcales bacterium]
SASSGGLVVANRRPPTQVKGVSELVDFGYVADVKTVDETVLECLWSGGFVPMLSSVVIDDSGQALNLNADTLVAALGKHLQADSVFFVADVPGVFADLDSPQSHIPKLTPGQIDELVSQGIVRGGMVAKLTEMGRLIEAGVKSVWIVGLYEDNPVFSALVGTAGRRTQMSAT